MLKANLNFRSITLIMAFILFSCAGREITSQRPEDADIYYKSGLAFLERDQLDLALNEFRKALEINPQHIEALHESGVVYLRKGELDQAAVKFHQVIKIKSDLPIAHRNLGMIYLTKKSIDQAIREFKEAVQLAPHEFYSHYLLGKAFLEKGIEELAILEFQETVRLNQSFPEVRKELAYIYHQKGHEEDNAILFEKAIKEIKSALVNSPDDGEAHELLGELYLDTGTYSPAIFEFQEALRLKPERTGIFKDLAFALAANNYFDQAIEKLHIYRALFSENSEAYRNLGHIYYILKEDRLATSMYRKALEFDPKSNVALWLYLTLLRTTKQEEAIKVLQKYVNGVSESSWEASLGRYLLKEQKTGEFIFPKKKEDRGPAFFFMGSYNLASGRISIAREYLTAGIEMNFYHSWEYLAARKTLEDSKQKKIK